jgi:hypothetical protein
MTRANLMTALIAVLAIAIISRIPQLKTIVFGA